MINAPLDTEPMTDEEREALEEFRRSKLRANGA
jgi:hypothetical protein